MNKQIITENKKQSILSLNAILNDFDELIQKQQQQDFSTEECRTIDRWARYTQSSKRSQLTRRQSQTDTNEIKLNSENNKNTTQMLTMEDMNEIKARIRFDQKSKEIEKKCKIKPDHKALEIIDINQIKAQVRQQLSQKNKSNSITSSTKKMKENHQKPVKQKTKCQQCIQLLLMGLPTKHCVNH